MNDISYNPLVAPHYCGKILTGNYSEALKSYVTHCITCYHAFDQTTNPCISYISAWHNGEKTIWYEFTGKRLIELLKCDYTNIAESFKNSVKDRREYSNLSVDTLTQEELTHLRYGLREESQFKGIVDAIYKISNPTGQLYWLKDQAKIEIFLQDNICLSLGCLTLVTKEMEVDELRRQTEQERLQKEKLQAIIEMAGAVCHELNQPMQAILGYAELLKLELNKSFHEYGYIESIYKQISIMAQITKKLMGITRYETKDYLMGKKIIDIDKSSKKTVKTTDSTG
ncbi:MAG: hypothetical protein HQK77_09160 [Desulfobacterales bacterium]|nr:hypothetical protein [Desulfobacterales bacterium]